MQLVKKLTAKQYMESSQKLCCIPDISDVACRLYSIYAFRENLNNDELDSTVLSVAGWSKTKYNIAKSELFKFGLLGERKRYLYLGSLDRNINTIVPSEKK